MNSKLLRQLDHCRVPHDTGSFEFRHSGRGYWVVTGPVPVDVAWEIYRDPTSSQIRVDGHCAAPEPVDPWIKWRMPDGTELATLEDQNEMSRLSHHSDPAWHQEYMTRFTFSDDPSVRARAKAYVETYHIDSEVGLRVFVDHLRWHNLI